MMSYEQKMHIITIPGSMETDLGYSTKENTQIHALSQLCWSTTTMGRH